MKTKLIRAALTAFIGSQLAGIFSMLIFMLLFNTHIESPFVIFFVGGVMGFFLQGALNIILFPIIVVFDKIKVEALGVFPLVKRYLPFIALPLSIPVVLIVVTLYQYVNDFYSTLSIVLNLGIMSYVSLAIFIKQFKSAS